MTIGLFLKNNMIYLLSGFGSISIITLLIGIYSSIANWSLTRSLNSLFGKIKNESERLAEKNKSVLKAEELGIRLTAQDYVAIVVISVLFGIIIAFVFKSIFLVVIGILISYMLPERLIDMARVNKQKAYLETAIPGTEMIAINNMHYPNMIKAISVSLNNMQDPFKSEMQQIVFEVNSGKYNLTEALDSMVYRTKSVYIKKVAASIKFADSIGGDGWKMLQADANLLSKDKEIYEKAEKRLKTTRINSYISSILQLAPIFVIKFSLPDTYDFVMASLIGQVILFFTLIKIIIDFYLISKKTVSIL